MGTEGVSLLCLEGRPEGGKGTGYLSCEEVTASDPHLFCVVTSYFSIEKVMWIQGRDGAEKEKSREPSSAPLALGGSWALGT